MSINSAFNTREGDAMSISFPYAPKLVSHKHGGKITLIHSIEHSIAKPRNGRSQDTWWLVCDVTWHDSGKSRRCDVGPWALCYEGEYQGAGHNEVCAISEALNAYLFEQGEWCGPGKHEGWYANRT